MHPKWQEKIYGFFKSLFTNNTGTQTSQVFMATHSDHVLKSALEDDNALIIKLNESGSNAMYKGGSGEILPTITLGEVKWRVFDMPTVDFYIQLYNHIQEHVAVDTAGNPFVDSSGSPTIANIKETDIFLCSQRDASQVSTHTLRNGNVVSYDGLSTYIRNCISHPDSGSYTEQQFRDSIEFMISLI